MTERRSVSQILFGYLPDQTVDVRGGIWKVQEWRGAIPQSNVDEAALRREIIRLARPWAAAGRDGGLVRDLENRAGRVVVKSLDRARGVHLRPFPEIWYCRSCRRIHDSPDARCCGGGRKGQLHFVMYCEDTAELREPPIKRCPEHDASRITFPGTASGGEIRFDCPTCGRHLRNGFGYARSSSGANMKVNVHRAASVFTPRSVVVINPPSPARMRELQEAGGGPRALEWVLDGMPGRSPAEGDTTASSLRSRLAATPGLTPDVIERMIAAAGLANVAAPVAPSLPLPVREAVEEQALTLALAVSEGRITLAELATRSDPHTQQGHRLRDRYPVALRMAGLERVDFIEKFPVLTGHFGYTRGPSEPGASRLMAYRERRGSYVVYGDIAETEALYVGLEPLAVLSWLGRRGHPVGTATDARAARAAILGAFSTGDPATDPVALELTTLVHSYAHRLIRLTAVHAGIELSSLSELLVTGHLGFFVYAAARGDFVLGGLQALFENDLDRLLREFVDGEHRCALDPGCTSGGGACVACLHLGEPSCRLFNRSLDRRVLGGNDGFLEELP